MPSYHWKCKLFIIYVLLFMFFNMNAFEQFDIAEVGFLASNISVEVLGMLGLSIVVYVEFGSSKGLFMNGFSMFFYRRCLMGILGMCNSTIVYTCFMLCGFICMVNLIGLISYNYTLSSQVVLSTWLSTGVWVGKMFVGYDIMGVRLGSVLLPSGLSIGMWVFFVLIETVSFIIPIVSLSVRLFANLLSGHVLLKVLVGFSWSMMFSGSFLGVCLSVLGMCILCSLYLLEFGVALVQGYVFTLLTGVYVNDVRGSH